MVKILDKNGRQLEDTTRNGKVRRLLKDKKARIVNDCPFTIQLLYDVEEILEDNQMNTNKKFTSEELDEFINKVGRAELFEERDGTLEHLATGKSIYYRKAVLATLEALGYNDDYVATTIKDAYDAKYNSATENVLDPLSIRLNNDVSTFGHVFIFGLPGQGKTHLSKLIAYQMAERGADVDFITTLPVFCDDDIDNLSKVNKHVRQVKELAKITANLRVEMMDRFKLMEKENVNSVYKLKDYSIKTKVLIIDDIDNYMCSDDYISVDTIKSAIDALLRLGSAAGILVIITCQSPSGIPTNPYDLIQSKILVGKASYEIADKLKNRGIPSNFSRGLGLYYNKANDQNWTMFAVNDVKLYV